MSIGADTGVGTVCMRMYAGVVLHACENMGDRHVGARMRRGCASPTPGLRVEPVKDCSYGQSQEGSGEQTCQPHSPS